MGEGYGVKYMHASAHPADLAVFAPWRGSAEHSELMLSFGHTAGYGILQRARHGGEIVVGKDGLPTPLWSLSDFDRDVMRKGLDGLAQILEAGGARRIYTTHAGWVSYEPGTASARVDARGRRRLRLGRRPGHARLVPPDGHGAHGKLARDRRVRPERRGLGCAQPVRGRRVGASDRPRREPDDQRGPPTGSPAAWPRS